MNNFLQVGRNSSVTQTSRILLEHSSFLPRSVYYRLKISHDRRISRKWIVTRRKIFRVTLPLIKLLTNEGAPPYSCPSRVSSTGTNIVRSPSFVPRRFSFCSSSSSSVTDPSRVIVSSFFFLSLLHPSFAVPRSRGRAHVRQRNNNNSLIMKGQCRRSAIRSDWKKKGTCFLSVTPSFRHTLILHLDNILPSDSWECEFNI